MIANRSPRRGALLAAVLLAGCVAPARAQIEQQQSKSFTVSRGGDLSMQVDRGSINLETADTKTLKIEVVRKARGLSRAEAEELFAEHEIRFEQDGNQISVKAEFKKAGPRGVARRSRLQVEYTVSLPKEFNVDLKTSGGSIRLADLSGQARLATSGGNLSLATIAGPVWGRTSGGSISLDGAEHSAELATSGGNIQVGDVSASVNAQTSGGSIRITRVSGNVMAKTSGGNIELGRVTGMFSAETSGGSISAAVAGPLAEASRLETSGGNIRLSIAEKTALDLDARASGAGVSTDVPVAVIEKQERGALRGTINGGGPLLNLRTSGGSISISKL